MRPDYYQKQWQLLKAEPNSDALQHLARRIAYSFIDRYFYSDCYEEEYISLLCEMATSFENERYNAIGTGILFGVVIEKLCDDFEELQTETYNRLIAQLVTLLRQLPSAQALNDQLNQFGLQTRQQLYDRIESIRSNSDRRRKIPKPPKKILVLSRVTIGADIAISSVICQRLNHQYPDAELVLVGSAKLQQIYAGNPGVRILPLQYQRHGNLLERFSYWLELCTLINKEIGELPHNEVLVFDPDSRLTQLGVLPIIDSESYFFFNSRGKDNYPKKISIAELTNFWLNSVLQPGPFYFPAVWPDKLSMKTADNASSTLHKGGIKHVISLNFGTGGNTRKRLEDEFEQKLTLALLKQPDTAILLDFGFGEEETARNNTILQAARQAGFPVQKCRFEELGKISELKGIVAVECNIGEVAALIAHSDEFIGYDSACQHMSAAMGKPTYTVFAGSNNVRFIRRWTACGVNTSEIIYVDTLTKETHIDTDDLVQRILDRRGFTPK